ICVQIITAAIAVIAQYKLAEQVGGRRTALLAGALIIFNADIARFHAYVLTDSLYASLLVILAWCSYKASRTRLSLWHAAAVGTVVLCVLLRPNGWLLPAPVLAYWALQRQSTSRRAALVGLLLVATM